MVAERGRRRIGGLGESLGQSQFTRGKAEQWDPRQMTAQLPGWGQEGGVRDSGPAVLRNFRAPDSVDRQGGDDLLGLSYRFDIKFVRLSVETVLHCASLKAY